MAIPTISDVAGLLTDPTIRFTQNNKAVANVRVAFNDSRYNDQTRQWETTKSFYVDCTAWENTAERLAEHFRKGDQVYIEGRIETEEWEHEGQKRSKPNLTIRTIRKLEKTQHTQQSQQQGNWSTNPSSAMPPTTGGGWGDQSQTSVWAGGGQQQSGGAPF
jgi:single-strand DNA-binding protein